MNQVVNDVVNAANQLDTGSVVTRATEAVIETVVNPNPATIISDITLAIQLVDELKAKLSGTHPSIMDVVKALFR